MSKQTTLFRFASAELLRLDVDENTETSQTTQDVNDETEDEDGHPSLTATSTTGRSTTLFNHKVNSGLSVSNKYGTVA